MLMFIVETLLLLADGSIFKEYMSAENATTASHNAPGC